MAMRSSRMPHVPSRAFLRSTLTIIGLGLAAFLLSSVPLVAGQPEIDPWLGPMNVSEAGSVAQSDLFIDGEGILHVIWQDEIDNTYVYAQSASIAGTPPVSALGAGSMKEPQDVELPFGTRRYFPDLDPEDPFPLFTPSLLVGSEGRIHSTWIDDSEDPAELSDPEATGGAGPLYHSRVQIADFSTYDSWTSRVLIAEDVMAADYVIGSDGVLHVAYIQNEDHAATEGIEAAPAGLYYRRSTDNGDSWSTPISLHQSDYFKLLTKATSNVKLDANEAGVFVVWDDWPHGRVFASRSVDNGETWEEPLAIDQRAEEDGLNSVSPSSIDIGSADGVIHLTWQAGHEGAGCNQYHSRSEDGGQSWQSRVEILTELTGCPSNVELLEGGETLVLLISTPSNRFLSAWRGAEWGEPEDQPDLNSIPDPITFQTVTLSCGQRAILFQDEIWVASCGEGASQDIWLQKRSISALARPPVRSVWGVPTVIAEGEQPQISLETVVDEANRYHVFWTPDESEDGEPFAPGSSDIHYSRQDEGVWSSQSAILSSPTGKTESPEAAVDGNGAMYVVWAGGESGEIFFSRATTENAILSSDWSNPQSLPMTTSHADSPQIDVDAGGAIYVVYATPLDEGRGLYLVTSSDNGDTWSEPTLVFDGAAAGWDVVGEPRLTITGIGQLHLILLRRPLPTSLGGDSLYYMLSANGGTEWSEAVPVAAEGQEGVPVVWHDITSSGGNILHRVWQEWNLARLTAWQQTSLDNGLSWSSPSQIAVFEIVDVPAALTADETGQAHLLMAEQTDLGGGDVDLAVRHWIWQGEGWLETENLVPRGQSIRRLRELSAFAAGGNLAAIYSANVELIDDTEVDERLFYSSRNLEEPEFLTTPEPVPTVTPGATATPGPTATPQPTATLVFPVGTIEPGGSQLIPGVPANMAGAVIGFGVAALVVVLLFLIVPVQRYRSSKNRHREVRK